MIRQDVHARVLRMPAAPRGKALSISLNDALCTLGIAVTIGVVLLVEACDIHAGHSGQQIRSESRVSPYTMAAVSGDRR